MAANPIGLIIVGVAALAAAIFLLVKNWDLVREKTIEIWNNITTFLKDTWGKIIGFFKENWDKILAILFPPIGLAILIVRHWGQAVDAVKDIFNRVANAIKEPIEAAFDWVIDRINWLVEQLNKIPGVAIGALSHVNLGENIQSYASGGIVPGPIGQPQLAIVHGGEIVGPSSSSGSSGITINIATLAVRQESDIDRIAEELQRRIRLTQRYA
jgi:phage-related protein